MVCKIQFNLTQSNILLFRISHLYGAGISKSVQNREERARATAMSTGADADAAHQPKITD